MCIECFIRGPALIGRGRRHSTMACTCITAHSHQWGTVPLRLLQPRCCTCGCRTSRCTRGPAFGRCSHSEWHAEVLEKRVVMLPGVLGALVEGSVVKGVAGDVCVVRLWPLKAPLRASCVIITCWAAAGYGSSSAAEPSQVQGTGDVWVWCVFSRALSSHCRALMWACFRRVVVKCGPARAWHV